MKEILIKKYDNRRLYCVEEARYVSLTEIRDFLQRGDKVKVVEKTTGKDITKYILMQVLLEERYELLPTYFYQMVLQSPKEVVDNFFKQFFPSMMDMYNKQMTGQNSFPAMGFQNPWMNANPFQFPNPFMPAPKAEEKPAKAKEAKDSGEDADKMAEILKRLRELEEKLSE
ncbi:MAG: polyhydroxyalkanoate synthesis regulator DNA-binding domain-containing protein [Candidatus Riflebacteria bacterium]